MYEETFYTTKDIKDTKLALISDIHYYTGYPVKILNKIIKQIRKGKPDYITIVGDILDTSNTYNLNNLEKFLKELTTIAPTIVVMGNHDEKKGSMKHWSKNINKDLENLLNNINNLYYLEDKNITFDNINFYGFNPSYKYYEVDGESYESWLEEINKINPKLYDNKYNITLIHTPINIYTFIENNKDHILAKSDLILSGHMHNGCLPFWLSKPLNKIFKTSRSIISPTRSLFPKYAQGRIYGNTNGYIYQGTTKISHSTKKLHIFDKLYAKNVQFINIKKR